MDRNTNELYDRVRGEINRIDEKIDRMDSEVYHRIFIDRDELVEMKTLLGRLQLKLVVENPELIHR